MEDPDELAREAYDIFNDKAKLRIASSPLDKYNSQVLKMQFWIILEQPVKVLPPFVKQLIIGLISISRLRRFTPHDLRSTMKSHMRALGISRDISEMCLNHKLPGVEGIYDQYTYYEERKEAYSIWGDFLAKLIVDDQADISS